MKIFSGLLSLWDGGSWLMGRIRKMTETKTLLKRSPQIVGETGGHCAIRQSDG